MQSRLRAGRPYRVFGRVADISHSGSHLDVCPASGKGPVFATAHHVQGRVPQVLLGQKVVLTDKSGAGFAFNTHWQRPSRALVCYSAEQEPVVHIYQLPPQQEVPRQSSGVVFSFLPRAGV